MSTTMNTTIMIEKVARYFGVQTVDVDHELITMWQQDMESERNSAKRDHTSDVTRDIKAGRVSVATDASGCVIIGWDREMAR